VSACVGCPANAPKVEKRGERNGRMALEAGNRESWAEFEKGRAYKGKETSRGRETQRRKNPGRETAARPINGKHFFFFFFFFFLNGR
jgi:hypothetical protein